MPIVSGSSILRCNLPIRIDTYRGCDFGCSYCYARTRYTGKVYLNEGRQALFNWINGKRGRDTDWCDWNIPLRWGVQSDPFTWSEIEYRSSLHMLELFADTQYPFVLTTKSTLIVEEPYFSLLKQCRCIVQVSLCSPQYDRDEINAPKFNDRLMMLEKLSGVSRLIVRVQPYQDHIFNDVMSFLSEYKSFGVYGVLFGMMYGSSMPDYSILRERCHELDLKFLSCDVECDDKTCCGIGFMRGFKANTANLNYKRIVYSDKMREIGTGKVFSNLYQEKGIYKSMSERSYCAVMEELRWV
jgi:hypothetical protein